MLVAPGTLPALVERSRLNIARSCVLVGKSTALVVSARRVCRPRLAGGSDVLDGGRPTADGHRVSRTRQKILLGALPVPAPGRRWMGPGRGGRCDGCGEVVTARDTEFEVGFRDMLTLRFHHECFTTWERFDRGSRRRP